MGKALAIQTAWNTHDLIWLGCEESEKWGGEEQISTVFKFSMYLFILPIA